MKKVIKDGKVAVLYSPGFGAGWSQWAWTSDDEKVVELMLYHPDLVNAVLDELPTRELEEVMERLCKEKDLDLPHLGGLSTIEVAWIPQGASFKVTEYDGSENIELRDNQNWHIA